MFCHLFAQNGLASLQRHYLSFVDRHHRLACGIHDAGDKGFDLLVDAAQFGLGVLLDRLGLGAACVPQVPEHGDSDGFQRLGRLKGFDNLSDIAFKLVATDGFAVNLATLGLAQIVGMARAIAGTRKRRAQGHIATRAGDDTAQHKFIADILAARRIGGPLAALLNLFKGLHRDQRFMLRFQPVDAVVV